MRMSSMPNNPPKVSLPARLDWHHGLSALVKSLFTNQKGEYVLLQAPNLPLWLYIACVVVQFMFPTGNIGFAAMWTGRVALAYWAGLEIYSGESWFRRGLGIVVLSYLFRQVGIYRLPTE